MKRSKDNINVTLKSETPPINVKTDSVFKFQKKYFTQSINISRELKSFPQEISAEIIANHLLQFKTSIWKQIDNPSIDRISYPLNWWEAIKERFFPKYILNKFPVKMKIIDIKYEVYYPKMTINLPDKYHTVRLTSESKVGN